MCKPFEPGVSALHRRTNVAWHTCWSMPVSQILECVVAEFFRRQHCLVMPQSFDDFVHTLAKQVLQKLELGIITIVSAR